jgi:hypothetical protein
MVDLTVGIMVGCGLAALFWGIARLRSKFTRP